MSNLVAEGNNNSNVRIICKINRARLEKINDSRRSGSSRSGSNQRDGYGRNSTDVLK